jgi:D-psicose/D-tagatose/L-ribulose 3-epimerase
MANARSLQAMKESEGMQDFPASNNTKGADAVLSGAGLLREDDASRPLRFGIAQFDRYDPLADIGKLAAWGFDYAEPAAVKVMALSEAAFKAAIERARDCDIHVEAMCTLLPADLKVVGPAVDLARLRSYLQKVLARAEALGVRTIMYGSAGSRNVPEGFPRERARAQLQEFLRWTGDEIARNDYASVIAIEPLRKAESNIVNSVAEALDLALETNHARIRIVVDFFHLAEEREDPAVLLKAKDHIAHLHFASPLGGRSFPSRAGEHPAMAAFFAQIRAIGYRGRLSLEANTVDFDADAPRALAALRQMTGQR